ncbi:MAG: glycerol kinase GlpK [Varibaculum sp.]|nr:glycerol kinase GlpK [Varibaculum sp.]
MITNTAEVPTPVNKLSGCEAKYVLAIDQGTTSSRAILFDHSGAPRGSGQLEHHQIFPHPGWVEHDPMEIWNNVRTVIELAVADAGASVTDIAAVGVTNQRETTIIWDRATGEPVYNALVWQDTRSQTQVDELAKIGGLDRFRADVGESLSTYASISKIAWVLENVPGVRQRAEAGELAFGNPDSWVIWNLTGGPRGGRHVTDATNASRTMLMDLRTLNWRPDICEAAKIPEVLLPEICSSAEIYGVCAAGSPLAGVPIAGDLGDQQAAAFGQACFTPGSAKNTYGTGCFMLLNTGGEPRPSGHGMITTLAYRLADAEPVYALEGSVAHSGSVIQWLRDNLGIISDAAQTEQLAASVPSSDGVCFVPAFSGLFAPHWRPDARALIIGLTGYHTRAHIVRAALEATAMQVREVFDAMVADSGSPLNELRVDGGMTANNLLMQFQADVLGCDVVVPQVAETTALGAAYAAGLAVGFWSDLAEVADNWRLRQRWHPEMDDDWRAEKMTSWSRAVSRTLDWVNPAMS